MLCSLLQTNSASSLEISIQDKVNSLSNMSDEMEHDVTYKIKRLRHSIKVVYWAPFFLHPPQQ